MTSGGPVRFRSGAFLDIVSGEGGLVDCRRLCVGDLSHRADRRLSRFAVYRGVRRVTRRFLSNASEHHH